MLHRRLAASLGAVAAAAAIGTTLTATSWAPKAEASPAAHGNVVVDCLGHKQVEPGNFVLACADGNSALEKLSWAAWTPKVAAGKGDLVQNDCNPYCAAGHFHSYPVIVGLRGKAAYHGSERFTELTLTFTGSRPEIYNGHKWVPAPRVETLQLWAPASRG
jgi:hypothetical protein